MQSLSERAFALLLGSGAHLRIRAAHSFLALLAYGLFALCQWQGVRLGVMDAQASPPHMAVYLTGGLLFYGLVRSGVSERWRDPSLTLPQTVFGICMAAVGYPLAGEARGGVIAVAMLAVFFAAIRLTARQGRALSAFAFLALALAMAWGSLGDSPRYPPRVELLLLLLTGISSAAMALLLGNLSRLRLRLTRQRRELVEALERIRQLATHDELTGLPNRRAVQDALLAETTRQARLGQPLAVVMIDLDRFKEVNDRHGHKAGDLVLRGFAERAETVLRGVDVLGRWGGEEFLLLLPDTSVSQAAACVDRLRDQLQRSPFDEVLPGLVLEFSAGLTACRGGTDIDAAIERADAALYRAKTTGRGRSEIA